MTEFLHFLYKWYAINKRDLPWRKTSNPYHIWISEIILQQTRVNQGLNYYLRFIENFPTLLILANSSEDKVLKMWQGLGYYSRARNLHYSSKTILEKYNGKFPTEFDDIIALKGIGEYTASAIASIAFNKPYAAVDGNISRVLARYFEITDPIDSSSGKNIIKKIAEKILNTKEPGMHNQALMELGAVICLPSSPLCLECPISATCLAFNNNTYFNLPVKNILVKQKKRYFYYFLIEEKDSIYIQKRNGNDIWKNLYEFPLVETKDDKTLNEVSQIIKNNFLKNDSHIQLVEISEPLIHILSHQRINARFIHLLKHSEKKLPRPLIRINKKDIHKFAVSRLIEKHLVKSGLIFSD